MSQFSILSMIFLTLNLLWFISLLTLSILFWRRHNSMLRRTNKYLKSSYTQQSPIKTQQF